MIYLSPFKIKSSRAWGAIVAMALSIGGYSATVHADTRNDSPAVQGSSAAELEAQTIAAAPKCVASTVGLVVRSQDHHSMRFGSGSGVLVSADGLILTAGHVVEKPGTPLTIRFADGRVVQGVALGVDRAVDTGMARITDTPPDGGWPFSPIAPPDSARVGDWVLATGNPGSVVIDRNPPLRLGRVTVHDETEISTNCTLEPGDSGGPVFDLAGRVVGINSRIMVTGSSAKDQSLHVPISLFSTQWNDLLASRNNHPEAADSMRGVPPAGLGDLSRIGEALQKLAAQNDAEALKLLADAQKSGGRMNLTPDQLSKLIGRAHLSTEPAATQPAHGASGAVDESPKSAVKPVEPPNPSTQPATEAPRRKGISGQLRPMIGPQIKRSLLKQFPSAKISDELLQRIMDKSSFNPTNGALAVHPDLEDLQAMGLTPQAMAEHAESPAQSNRVAQESGKNSLQTLSLFVPALNAAGDCVVEIRAGDKPVLLGTIVDADGLIVTKASDLPKHPMVVLADGKRLRAKVLGKDNATDLALLKIDAKGLTAAKFSDSAPLGTWLGSPVSDPNDPAVGIVSVAARPIPETFAHFTGEQRIILGLGFRGDDRIVAEVTHGMPAEAAGIKAGDEVLELDGKPVTDPAEFVATIKKAKAGDTPDIKIRRDGKELEFKPVLGQVKNTTETQNGVGEVDNLAGGNLSKRRTNFPMAIQHDAALGADQCGGPLINLHGQTVGINIARYDRVCVFAIPADLVQKTIAMMRTKAAE